MRRPGIPPVLADLDQRVGLRFGHWALLAGVGLGLVLVWMLRPPADATRINLVEIQNMVLGLTGNAGVEVRHLGDGILELVGKVETPAHAQALVECLGEAPGVKIVLDRLWVRPPRLVS